MSELVEGQVQKLREDFHSQIQDAPPGLEFASKIESEREGEREREREDREKRKVEEKEESVRNAEGAR